MMRWIWPILLSAMTPTPMLAAAPTGSAYPEATPYDKMADSTAAVDTALSRAKLSGKRVIIVMGANWCHDSRALAGWFESPRFAAMLKEKYEVVYVDAGMPQMQGQERNQHIIKRFGGKKQKGTPYIMILSTDGKLLNKKDAPTWRNAQSRGEEAVYQYFQQFT